jgi:hypothetical protein
MARLLEVYEDMLKEAEFAKVAEEIQIMFAKYAETAESLLKEEYGTDFNTEDVESLARGLMERDSEFLEESTKVAEYEAIGRELARQFVDETKTAGKAGMLDKGLSTVKRVLKRTSTMIKRKPLEAGLLGAGGLGAGAAAGSMLSGGDN